MNKQMVVTEQASAIELVVVQGDLGKLSPDQRVQYYRTVCDSVGLNPFTKPFDYITLNGRLTLYARKDATEQLRRLHGVSIDKPDIEYTDDLVVVTVTARNGEGRTDSDLGAVTIANLRGDGKANAIMKAITKAKRRVTLSICGLGWLDETEIETIPSARPVEVDAETGEIVEGEISSDVIEEVEEGPDQSEIEGLALATLKAVRTNSPKKFEYLLANMPYYKNLPHLKGAWKKLGWLVWQSGNEYAETRVAMANEAFEYAKLRASGVDQDAALDFINELRKTGDEEE